MSQRVVHHGVVRVNIVCCKHLMTSQQPCCGGSFSHVILEIAQGDIRENSFFLKYIHGPIGTVRDYACLHM